MMHTRKQSRRTCGISFAQMVREIAIYLRGWLGYFGDCQTPSVLQSLGRTTDRTPNPDWPRRTHCRVRYTCRTVRHPQRRVRSRIS
jgi:hypothetical protein